MRFSLRSVSACFLALLLCGLTACSKASKGTDQSLAAVKLPDVAVGDFQGILALSEGGVAKRSFANVRCTVAASGDRYRLTFSGGVPMVPAELTAIDNLIFVATPGSQQGVFHTVARDGSIEGIQLSTYMTNLNVDVPVSGGGLIYTGRK